MSHDVKNGGTGLVMFFLCMISNYRIILYYTVQKESFIFKIKNCSGTNVFSEVNAP